MRPATRVFRDLPALVEGAVQDLMARIAAVHATRGSCRIALAGGDTPRQMYQRLAQPDLASRIDWERIEVFWSDERCVPPTDPRSNYRMACDALLSHVPVPATGVHRIDGEAVPEEAARAYEQELGREPLDLVLLGMGADGHVASLFPGRPEATERTRKVVPAQGPKPPPQRISLTLRAINEARAVCFWVANADKADRVADVFDEIESGARMLPAAQVQPASGELLWLLDATAAGRL
jgi:6-phosphogluconolactonase